jgi:hypothetical protein
MTDKLIKAFDPSAARKVLQQGIDKGLWTLEDLDVPTQGYLLTTGQRWNPATQELEWKNDRTLLGHISSIPKHQIKPHRNLLRDANTSHTESVQASADPRDFDPRPVSGISDDSPQVLRPQEEEIHSQERLGHSEEERLPEPLPF